MMNDFDQFLEMLTVPAGAGDARQTEHGLAMTGFMDIQQVKGRRNGLHVSCSKAFTGPEDCITAVQVHSPGVPDVKSKFPYLESIEGYNSQIEKLKTQGVPDLLPPPPDTPVVPDKGFCKNEWRTPCDYYVEGEVRFGTDKALQDMLDHLPKLMYSSTGCIVSKEMDPVGGVYNEDVHYLVIEGLGRGSYGQVDLCRDTGTGQAFIRKEMEASLLRSSEAIIPRTVDHENITKFYGLIKQSKEDGPPTVQLLLEYGGLSLSSFIYCHRKDGFEESEIWDLALQGVRGLECLDKYGMNHFDVKPENLCVQEVGGRLVMKITDFGSAKLAQERITFVGWTTEYMAPECCKVFLQDKLRGTGLDWGLTQADITGKADVFSFGLVICYMYKRFHVLLKLITQGHTSYNSFTEQQRQQYQSQLLISLAGDETLVQQLIPDESCIEMRELIMKLTEYHPEQRYTAHQAREHIEYIQRGKAQQRMNCSQVNVQAAKLKQKLACSVSETLQAKLYQSRVPETANSILEMDTGPVKNSVKQKLRAKLKPYQVPMRTHATEPTPESVAVLETPVEGLKQLSLQEEDQTAVLALQQTWEDNSASPQQQLERVVPNTGQEFGLDLLEQWENEAMPTPSLLDFSELMESPQWTSGNTDGFDTEQILLEVTEDDMTSALQPSTSVSEVSGNVPNFGEL